MNKAILQNYLTTLFGIMAGLPVIVLGVFTPAQLGPMLAHALVIVGGVGTIGLGVVSKAFNVHSTTAQAAAAQSTVEGKIDAPAQVIAADAQVAESVKK